MLVASFGNVNRPVLLIFPHSGANRVAKEYLGEIVRVDDLGERGRAVAVQFHPSIQNKSLRRGLS